MFLNEADRMVTDRVRVVVGFRPVVRIGVGSDVAVVTRERIRIEKTPRTMDGSVKTVEAPLQGPIPFIRFLAPLVLPWGDMPLSGILLHRVVDSQFVRAGFFTRPSGRASLLSC